MFSSYYLVVSGPYDDELAVQVLIQDNSQASDPHSIGFPSGFINWSHALDVFEAFLRRNPCYCKDVSGDNWAMCRSVELRIIAIREPGPRDKSKCVVARHDPDVILKGPSPVPKWEKRRGHYQEHLDKLADDALLLPAPIVTRDLGLDSHDSGPWSGCGGYDQNAPPSFVESPREMFGYGVARPTSSPESSSGLSSPDHGLDCSLSETGCGAQGDSAADATAVSMRSLDLGPGPSTSRVDGTPLTSTRDLTSQLSSAAAVLQDLGGCSDPDPSFSSPPYTRPPRGLDTSEEMFVSDESRMFSDLSFEPMTEVSVDAGVGACPYILYL